jgi:hypothetical protein
MLRCLPKGKDVTREFLLPSEMSATLSKVGGNLARGVSFYLEAHCIDLSGSICEVPYYASDHTSCWLRKYPRARDPLYLSGGVIFLRYGVRR